MRLRPFKKCDANTIISWIKDERVFRYWCADRFESYPITGSDLINQYEGLAYSDDIFHFVAYDDSGIVGHFNIRFPDPGDIKTVRLGYVIIDDKKRGLGIGQEMIELALEYAVTYMNADKVTIGVFAENEAALNCYLKSGFTDSGVEKVYEFSGRKWICKELVYYSDTIDASNLTAEEYLEFRKAVGWADIPLKEAQKGLRNSYIYCIRENDIPIALGRIVRDKGYVVYIADVIVLPDYQGKGYGRRIMEKLMSIINESMKPGEKIMINLMAASGKEDFYQKFGFIKRPNDTLGCGMCKWVEYGKQ